ncbi:MAG: tryptophan 7-halogenase [Myxococcaceae bacterium]|nr:tryptophan 7-halogenase [Myxococcaceae bacterium]
MSMQPERFDVVVIGGGPAGSTAATLSAMQGHKVLLLDRVQHPRYSIGESLLPSTIHGIVPMLGVADEVKRANFQKKFGGYCKWGASPDPWTFHFARALTDPTGYAYQVERSRFDAILINNAARKGVDVRQQHAVSEIIEERGRVTGVRFTDGSGKEGRATSRVVVDCSGHTTRFHEQVGERVFSKFFQNMALFAYYEGAKRMPPPSDGNILIIAFDMGWFWFIPLSPKLTSVGAVIGKEHAGILKKGNDVAMRELIERAPIIKDHLSTAKRVETGEYGEYRVRRDWSYMNTKFWKPGMMLCGDAACFIDPIISTGVHLATYSGLQAARSINTVLRGDLEEEECFIEYERRYRREYNNFHDFLVGFYDWNKHESSYFWHARRIVSSDDEAKTAFVRLVAGANNDEQLYENPQEFAGAAISPGAPTGTAPPKPHGEGDGVTQHLLGSEAAQMLAQASFGRERERRVAVEKPLFEGGLVPSLDGFHWRRSAS